MPRYKRKVYHKIIGIEVFETFVICMKLLCYMDLSTHRAEILHENLSR